MHFGLGLDWRPSGIDSEFKISTRKKEEKEYLQKESDNLLYDEEDFSVDCLNFKKVYTRVFLKGHFVKKQISHPST